MQLRTMRLNTPLKAIGITGSILILLITLFPPWQQAAMREVDYRKYLGRGFVFSPPSPVAVDCYFVGCLTAPPSYFHVLIYQDLVFEQLVAVFCVALIMLWMFRSQKDGTQASLRVPKTRWRFSLLIALLIPLYGTFPLASDLVNIPKQLIGRGEFWLVWPLITLVLFVALAGVIYLLISGTLWIFGLRKTA
jgi:hypothetical protein